MALIRGHTIPIPSLRWITWNVSEYINGFLFAVHCIFYFWMSCLCYSGWIISNTIMHTKGTISLNFLALLVDPLSFFLWFVWCSKDVGCLLHDPNQQVVNVVLKFTYVCILLFHNLFLFQQFLHNFIEWQVAVRCS